MCNTQAHGARIRQVLHLFMRMLFYDDLPAGLGMREDFGTEYREVSTSSTHMCVAFIRSLKYKI